MTSPELYAELISTISPEKTAIYLEYKGWHKDKEVEGVISLWSKNNNNRDKKITILLPLDNEFADFEIKMEELVTVLSRVEKRAKAEILKVLVSTSVIAKEKNRELIDIKIEFEDRNQHEVSAKKIGLVLKSLEDFFGSIADNRIKNLKDINQKNLIKEELQLSLIDSFQGSFGLRVGLAQPQQLNLFDTLAQEAAEDFMNLIKASSLDNVEKLRQEIERYQGEPSVRFKYLIKYFMELESDLVLEWGSVNPEKGGITKFPFYKIVQAFDVISKFELDNKKVFQVIGRLIVAGIGKSKNQRMFVLNDEVNNKQYRGHISEELIYTLDENIELNEIYDVTIAEELTLNSITAEEIYTYTLVTLNKVSSNK